MIKHCKSKITKKTNKSINKSTQIIISYLIVVNKSEGDWICKIDDVLSNNGGSHHVTVHLCHKVSIARFPCFGSARQSNRLKTAKG